MFISAKENYKIISLVFAAFFIMISASYIIMKKSLESHLKSEIKELMKTSDIFVSAQLQEVKGVLTNVSSTVMDKLENKTPKKEIGDYLVKHIGWIQKYNINSTNLNSIYGFVDGLRGDCGVNSHA